MEFDQFRNRDTGHVWAANPGSPEYVRMSSSEQFEPVSPEPAKPSKRSRSKPAEPADGGDTDVSGE